MRPLLLPNGERSHSVRLWLNNIIIRVARTSSDWFPAAARWNYSDRLLRYRRMRSAQSR